MVITFCIYRQYIEMNAGDGSLTFFNLIIGLTNVHSRGCGKGKWYKFNDTVIEEFDLNDETLSECFEENIDQKSL